MSRRGATRQTLAVDLSYRLVYGAGVAGAYDALERLLPPAIE